MLAGAINSSDREIKQLDVAYGKWLGGQVREFITDYHPKVDLIASHGHTIFHEPEKGITLQIGDGREIARATGVVTIADFRSLDVSLGGQGAPLVPIGDELLFSDFTACLNLGGIANISYRSNDQRVAFDVGLANMSLNYLAQKTELPYDANGELAASGQIDYELLNALNGLPYFARPAPKSLGFEWFSSMVKPLLDVDYPISDLLATVVEHEAMQIGIALNKLADTKGNVLVTGGGTFNDYLLERIRHFTPSVLKIVVPPKELIDFKEALIFALMGVLRFRNENNCLSSVTGASRDSSGGVIFNP